jgi:hypothetical protein
MSTLIRRTTAHDGPRLRAEIVTGDDRHRHRGLHRHAGSAQGKRLHGQFFLDHVLAHGTEGCNYLLTVDVEMNTVRRLRDHVLGAGVRRHVLRPRPRHLAAHAGPAERGDHPVRPRPGSTGRVRSRSRRAPSSRSRLARAAELGYRRLLPAPSWSSSSSRTAMTRPGIGATIGLTGANRYNVDYSILGGSEVEPVLRDIRNEMYAAGLNVESAKGECNLGSSTRSASSMTRCCAPATTTPSTRRRQGDRRRARPVDHLHGEVRRARRQLLPHPPVAARHRRHDRLRRRRSRDGRAERAVDQSSSPGCSRRCASSPTSTHRISTPTSDSSRLVRADRGGLGQRQPHLRPARRRPRCRAAGREPGPRG